MSIEDYRYKFYYDKEPEDFFDKGLYDYAITDMWDKYWGNREKSEKYYESLKRLKSHIKVERFSFKDSNNNIVDGEYQTISNYSNLSDDLKILQLEDIKEKLEKSSKALAGDESIYNGNDDELERDLKYIETNNFAYNRNQMITQNLRTLGRYGESVRTNSKLLNAILFGRNNIRAPINRFIGRGASKAYSTIFKGPSGLYDSKPTHRYNARRDYFYNKEKQKLEEKGKKVVPFITIWKARINAVVKYKEGNNSILRAGADSIKSSVTRIQQTKYLTDKYNAVNEHIKYLKEKIFMVSDEQEVEEIKKYLTECLNNRDEIRESEFFDKEIIKKENLEQTDAISFEQHLRANKDNVTRAVTGAKTAVTAGMIYVGPKIKEWILEHTKIPTEVEQNTWVAGHYDRKWIEGKEISVDSYTKDDLLNNFSIKNMMEVSKDNTAYYSYSDLEKIVSSNNLEYFRGIAQKIDGKVISLSDGNGFDINGITSGLIPNNLMVNGNLSNNATIFDLIAALRTKAGKPTTSDELLNQILSLNSIEKQNDMIKNLTKGIEFWKSTNKSGIATGWNESTEEINTIINSLSGIINSRKQMKVGHFENVFVPGFLKTQIVEKEIINSRILKACNITEDMIKGLATADVVNMIYENLRNDSSGNKIIEIERIRKQDVENEKLSLKIKEILDVEDIEERFNEINNFNDLDKLTDVNYIEIINSFSDNPDLLINLLNNDKFYSKENLKFILGNLLNSKDKHKILESTELLKKIQETTLNSNDIDFIINAYERDKDVLKLFPKNEENYLKNEELILRKTTVEYDEAVINRLLYLKNIDKREFDVVKLKLKALYEINDEILDTVNLEILTSKYNNLAEEINVLTVYPKIQEQICGLSENEYKMFTNIIKNVKVLGADWILVVEDLLENVSEYDELINKDDKFINYIKNLNTENVKNSDNRENLNELMKVMDIMSNHNTYDIKTVEDIVSFSRDSNASMSKYYEKREKDEDFKKLSKYDKLKDLIFQKYIGADIKTAKRLFEYFGKDIDSIINNEESEEDIKEYLKRVRKIDESNPIFKISMKKMLADNNATKEFLLILKNVLEEDDFDNLLNMYKENREHDIYIPKVLIESKIRGYFTRQKNKSLYMLDDNDRVKIAGEDAYLISDDFNLQLTSVESYAHDNWIFKKDDEKKVLEWDCKKVKTHGISTTFCGNKNLSLPPIHGVCYAFDSLNDNALLKSAPWDLGAWSYNKDFNVFRSQAEFGTMFTLPETQLKYTLRRHNEDVLERRNLKYKEGDKYKLQPSYLVSFTEAPLSSYFKKTTDEILTSEKLKDIIDFDRFYDKKYQRKVNEQELEKDEKWKKTIEESDKKGFKKVIVDRTHTLINERLINDEKEKRFLEFNKKELNDKSKMSEFLKLMEDIIVEFDAARAGVIQKEIKGWNSDGGSNYGELLHKEIYDSLYSYKVMDDKLAKIEAKIASLDKEKIKICMEKMKEISGNQVEKLSKSYWWYEYDTSYDWYHYYKHAGRELADISFGKDDKIISELLDRKVEGTDKKGGQVVYELINDIKSIHEYDIPDSEEDWHGRKHINNVVLFSYLIEQNEKSLGKDIDLLLQAAKYHDVGRDGNWNGQGPGKRHDKDKIPHAYPSAIAAEFYLGKELDDKGNRKYTDDQIAMVKVAIAYHEVNEKNKNQFNNESFERLCRSEKVNPKDIENTKLMCIYLKDADALDRTRFLYEEKGKDIEEQKDNLDLRYLRTNTAIALRDFSRDISNQNNRNKRDGSKEIVIPEVLKEYAVPAKAKNSNWKNIQNQIKKYTLGRSRKPAEEELSESIRFKTNGRMLNVRKRKEFEKFKQSMENPKIER